jgi:broad specificity phosphatase PhoE
MSRLFLIRHAQASFFEADYDKLSCLGEEQARLLGQYWSQRSFSFDRIYSGPRLRQKSTAAIVSDAFHAAGRAFPELTVLPEFDEYPGDVVLRQSLPRLLESDAQVRQWHREHHSAPDLPEKLKHFQRIFEAVIGKWVAGELSVGGVESWPEFCARVNRGLSQILSRAESGQQLAVFSSGGPVGVAMQRALNLSPQDTLRTVWMSRNCSYSEFLFSGGRFTLSTFNAFPHLDDPSLLTYR